jgi:hypothetical protein
MHAAAPLVESHRPIETCHPADSSKPPDLLRHYLPNDLQVCVYIIVIADYWS